MFTVDAAPDMSALIVYIYGLNIELSSRKHLKSLVHRSPIGPSVSHFID